MEIPGCIEGAGTGPFFKGLGKETAGLASCLSAHVSVHGNWGRRAGDWGLLTVTFMVEQC